MEIRNRYTGAVLFAAEVPDDLRDASFGIQLGWTVRRALRSGANLYGADLSRADLYGANLSDANLYGANLYGANLSRADLSRADLYGAKLSGADLSDANLSDANLSRANLSRANLSRANLYGAKAAELAIAKTRILPEGDLIGYKKLARGVIAKLLIPADAARSHAYSRKCRAAYATVLEMTDATGAAVLKGESKHDSCFIYEVGQVVRPDSFDPDWRNECAPGIHFFITRIEAENY